MEIHPYSQCNVDLSKYQKGKRIKKGGFGSVYIAQEIESGISYAAKVVDCDDNAEQCKKLIDRELGIMMCINHPTLIKFIGFSFQDFERENNVTIIMDLANNGSLADILKKIQESNGPKYYTNTTKQIILIGVSRGMKYLHNRNIIHRDLKPSNILLDNDFHPHITDFGLSKFYEINHSKSQSQTCGTLSYMSPEVIRGSLYDTKTDVYSFAILMFEVLTDLVPYPDLENGKLTDFDFRIKVVNENYRPKFLFPIKENLRSLIEECWSSDPNDRPTFNEIFNKLTNPEFFIDEVDSSEIDIYIQDITETNDPFETIINRNEKLEKENNELKIENKNLNIFNKELLKFNEILANENQQMKKDIEKYIKIEPIITKYMKTIIFFEYINSHKINPISEIDESLKIRIENLSKQNPAVLGFNNEEDGQIIIQNYSAVISLFKIKGTLHQLFQSNEILFIQTKYQKISFMVI